MLNWKSGGTKLGHERDAKSNENYKQNSLRNSRKQILFPGTVSEITLQTGCSVIDGFSEKTRINYKL